MWKYYGSLFRDIPAFFRGTVEAYAFWVLGAAALLTSLWPQLATIVERFVVLPRWGAPTALGLILLYGLLRVNYQRFKTRDDRVNELEALPSKRYLLACELYQNVADLSGPRLVSDE